MPCLALLPHGTKTPLYANPLIVYISTHVWPRAESGPSERTKKGPHATSTGYAP